MVISTVLQAGFGDILRCWEGGAEQLFAVLVTVMLPWESSGLQGSLCFVGRDAKLLWLITAPWVSRSVQNSILCSSREGQGGSHHRTVEGWMFALFRPRSYQQIQHCDHLRIWYFSFGGKPTQFRMLIPTKKQKCVCFTYEEVLWRTSCSQPLHPQLLPALHTAPRTAQVHSINYLRVKKLNWLGRFL